MRLCIFFARVAFCSHPFLSASGSPVRDLNSDDQKFPIILVHGLLGWDRETFPTYKYWGKEHHDYESSLKEAGYEVHTATIGPLSSNWDRACELYAVVKGGQVDYGQGHARKFKHKQLGRTYKGLYPQWGEEEPGKIKKVHFIAHSMGGPTVRMLSHLLAFGAKGSKGGISSMVENTHPFYAGGRDWIESITFLESPLHGTVLSNKLYPVQAVLIPIIRASASLYKTLFRKPSIDLHLDQWKINSWGTFKKALRRWALPGNSYKDTAFYSLTTKGAAKENEWIKESKEVYYFLYTTGHDIEMKGIWSKMKCPERVILQASLFCCLKPQNSELKSKAKSTSTSKSPTSSGSEAGGKWGCSNDGLVETKSMAGDHVLTELKESLKLERGKWYYFAHFPFLYHAHMTGRCRDVNPINLLKAHSWLLYNLPLVAVEGNEVNLQPKQAIKGKKVNLQPKQAIEGKEVILQLIEAIDQVKKESAKFVCKFLPRSAVEQYEK